MSSKERPCSPEMARRIVDLLCDQCASGDLLQELRRHRTPEPVIEVRPLRNGFRRSKVTAEVEAFILDHHELSQPILRQRMATELGVNICESTISKVLHAHGMVIGRKHSRKLTAEIIAFVKGHMGSHWRRVADLVESKFGVRLSVGTVYKAWNS